MFSYQHSIGKTSNYFYSNVVVGEIKKEPHEIIIKLKKTIGNNKKE